MTSLGFENYAEALKIYLARYREVSQTLIPIVMSDQIRLSMQLKVDPLEQVQEQLNNQQQEEQQLTKVELKEN
jgi:hypothetical protein